MTPSLALPLAELAPMLLGPAVPVETGAANQPVWLVQPLAVPARCITPFTKS